MPKQTFLEYLEETFKFKPVESPLAEVKGTAMVLCVAAGRSILGSVADIVSEGLQEVFYPMGYMEVPKQDPHSGQITAVNSQMGKEFALLRTPRWKFYRVDSMYFLDSELSQDKKMAVEYDRAITHIRAADSGVEIASPSALTGGGSVTPLN